MPNEPVLSITVKLKDLFTSKFQRISDSVRRGTSKIKSGFIGLGRTITNLRTVIRGFIFYELMKLGKDLVERGNQIEAIRRAFQNMAARFGQDSQKILQAMKKASRGMLSDFALMQKANNAFLLQVAKTPEEFAQVTEAARRLGQAMGVDLGRAMDSLILGIGRQSIRWLDNIGLIVKAEDANEKYAASIGKTVSQLSAMERRKAFKLAVWDSMQKKMASLGDDVDLAANAWGRFNASISNVYNIIADRLRPALKELADGLADMMKTLQPLAEWFATSFSGALQMMGESLRNFGSFLGYWWGRFESRGGWVSKSLSKRLREQRISKLRAAGRTPVSAPPPRAGWRPQATGLHPPGEMDWANVAWTDVVKAEYLGTQERWRMSAEEARTYLDAIMQLRDNMLALTAAHAEGARGAAKMWASLKAGAVQYADMTGTAAEIMTDSFRKAFEMIEGTIATTFFDAMTGKLKSFKEYMRAFLKDIARMLSQLAAKMMMVGIISRVTGLFMPGGATNAAVGKLNAARITAGGYPTHAEGGIVTRPHFGLVGEAGPEAIIPLKRGSVPVELKGGAGRNVTVNFNISAMDGPSVKRVLHEERRTIEMIIRDALGKDPHMRMAVRSA